MMTGAALVIVGLLIGFTGGTSFNFGTILFGWGMALVGAAVFLTHLVSVP
jgi:hypothetical protein